MSESHWDNETAGLYAVLVFAVWCIVGYLRG